MSSRAHESSVGTIGAIATLVGTLLSGPLAFVVVSTIAPQPPWSGPSEFVANYHMLQSISFYFGHLLVVGSVMIIAAIHAMDRSINTLLALAFTCIACGLIALNYFTQSTFVPALVRNYTPDLDPIISMLAVPNPNSIFWAIEMWGYGFLGLGTWLAASFFGRERIERLARGVFILNGIVSIAGAFATAINLEWVLAPAGLVSYAVWNVLYLTLPTLFLLVLMRRRTQLVAATT